MSETVLVDRGNAIWTRASTFIRSVYRDRYGAELNLLPNRLFVRLDSFGDVICAAGLRSSADGFFSEYYLDRPVEEHLSTLVKRPIGRSVVCEVTTLVSRAHHQTSDFIDDLVRQLADLDFDWSFYTLTRRLALMLQHKHLSPLDLAPAHPDRVPNPEQWGRYYATSPRVFAVSIDHLHACERFSGVFPRHAVPSRNALPA